VHEAALRAMKRSLFRLHVFLPLEKRQKKMVEHIYANQNLFYVFITL
jgi:hypothetical protein